MIEFDHVRAALQVMLHEARACNALMLKQAGMGIFDLNAIKQSEAALAAHPVAAQQVEIERLQAELVSIRAAWNKAEEELAATHPAPASASEPETVPWPKVTSCAGGASEDGAYAWVDVQLTDGPETTRFVRASARKIGCGQCGQVLGHQEWCASASGASEEITDDMIRAFHDATTDGALDAEASADIRAGLRAAFLNRQGASQPLQAMADNERELGLGYETGASEELPGRDVHRNEDTAAEAYERDYWSDLAQQKADVDTRRGVHMPVSYYVVSILCAMQSTERRAALSKPAGQGDGEAGELVDTSDETPVDISADLQDRTPMQRLGDWLLGLPKLRRDAPYWTNGVFAADCKDAAEVALAAPQTLVHADVERDAARYRLIRRGQHWSVIDWKGDDLRGEVLDATIDAIDAARKPSTDAEGGANG